MKNHPLSVFIYQYNGANDHPVTVFDIERRSDKEHLFSSEQLIQVAQLFVNRN